MVNYRVVAVLSAYLILAWFTGTLLHLKGADLWILRGGLALLGFIGLGAFVWFQRRMNAPPAGDVSAESASGDIDLIVRNARVRLEASKLGRQWGLGQIPVLYVLGDTGSAKTTIIVHSGLDPELLAGHVYQDNQVVPTNGLNLWYTRQALFVDTAGSLLKQPALARRLLKHLRPQRWTALGRATQPPQAALVCVDCESLTKDGAETVSAAARRLSSVLQDISRVLGIEFPVYVLFTRADRVPFFAEYARGLTKEEAAEPFGTTLPMAPLTPGVYAEEQTRRLTDAFDQLFCCAAEKRLDLLARETEIANLAGVYQFPREVRKLRKNIIQFLVDLVRPSHLGSTPFLRGFYFCGARATTLEEEVVQPKAATPPRGIAGATMAFQAGEFTANAAVAAPARVTRRVPEWIFLSHLLGETILKDNAALGTSAVSSRTSVARRMMFAAAVGICIFLAAVFLVSFLGNRNLEAALAKAVANAPAEEIASADGPSLEKLGRLETLRQEVEKLGIYEREGAPLRLRWFLYAGNSLYPRARQIYFDSFRKTIFAQTQADMLKTLQQLPPVARPTDDYDPAYLSLKGYLITTSDHDKSSVEFLTPVLMTHFLKGGQGDPAAVELVRKQFDFYAVELRRENPYSISQDSAAVERARMFLAQFTGTERLYRFMLSEATRKNPSIKFNQMFPGSSDALVQPVEVEGAFTKAGWDFVEDTLKHLERLFAGEEWVLGQSGVPAIDRAKLQQELQTRYRQDFVQRWRNFLAGASVVRYRGPKDAAKKLGQLAGNESPVLAVFSVVSQNTSVGAEEIVAKFQPSHSVVPAGARERFVGPTNAPYMTALISLQTAMEQVAANPSAGSDNAVLDPARTAAVTAKQAAYQISQGFTVDSATQIDDLSRKLLESPIKYAEDVINDVGTGDLNGKARALCERFRELGGKYPFNPNSTQQVSVAELNGIFKPKTGAIWTFYDQNLQALVLRKGSVFTAGPNGATLNPAFLSFFNRAAAFSESVYSANAEAPRLAFRLKPQAMPGLQSMTLGIANQSIGTSGGAKQFTWQWGESDQVRLVGKMGGTEFTFLNYRGPWSVFQFFASAERSSGEGPTRRYEWVPKTSGQPFMVSGKPLTVAYELEMSGTPVFQKNYFSQMQCVPRATR